MQAHIMSLHTHSAPGVESKGQTFLSESSHATYQIKGDGARAPCKHTFCPHTHT